MEPTVFTHGVLFRRDTPTACRSLSRFGMTAVGALGSTRVNYINKQARRRLNAQFQAALSQARHAEALTQSELAVRLGRPQSFVSKYESGERRLDVIEFLEVADAIGIDACSVIAALQRELRSPDNDADSL